MGYFLSEMQKMEINSRVNAIAKSDTYYYIMVILACTIATYGLISNSAAVIIGAMLISPIMGSILGSAMAVSEEDNSLLRKSFTTLMLGAIIAIVFSIVLTLFIPVKIITPEIIARTKPTIIDLIIALASGAAATYAICYKPDSAALPGVAISTALMPPLCVVGIGIANNNLDISLGALLLFLANIIAINFSSVVIFKIFGLRKISDKELPEEKKLHLRIFKSNLTYSVLLLLLISLPLGYFMLNYFEESKVEDILRTTIKSEFVAMSKNAQIVTMDIKNTPTVCKVYSVIRSTIEFQSKDIRQIENVLEYKLGRTVNLNMDVVLVQKISKESSEDPYKNLINSITAQGNDNVEKSMPSIIERVESPEVLIGNVLNEKFSLVKGLNLIDYSSEYRSNVGNYKLKVSVNFDGTIEKSLIDTISSILEEKLKRKVFLEILIIPFPKESNSADESIKNKDAPKTIIPLPEEQGIFYKNK